MNFSKAVVMKAPGQLELREFPKPTLQNGSILAKVKLCGICGTDVHMFKGHLNVDFPIIPGHELVAEVYEIGGSEVLSDVLGNAIKQGDLIVWPCVYDTCRGKCWYCRWYGDYYGTSLCQEMKAHGFQNCETPPHLLGGWAEYIYLPPTTWVYKVPEGMPEEIAILVDPLSSSNGIERAVFHSSWLNRGLNLSSVVVIQGSGPIGTLGAVKARSLGANRVLMVGGPAERLEVARDFGVDETLNIFDVPEARERIKWVRDLTGGLEADVVVECTGVPDAVPEGLEMLKRGGVYVEIGHYTDAGDTKINPHSHLLAKDVTLIAQAGYARQQFRKDLALLERLRSSYPFRQLVTHTFDLADATKALEIAGTQRAMKVAIRPN